ncbi:MAG TPA: hypothetical protein VK066_27715 [Chloroflexota bacterium]|nr:hypothetical protein [Chloroflexota bacterium]
MQQRSPTAVWLGRLAPGAEAEQATFLAMLRDSATRRRLRENYHLTGYRLEADGDRLRVTFSGETPAALANFLKAHRLWPSFWRYEGRGEVEPPGHGGRTVLFDLDA